MYEMQGPRRALGSTLTCRFLDCHTPCPAYYLVSSSRTSSGSPAFALTFGSPRSGPAVQVVSEFLLPLAMTAQGLRPTFSKILSLSTGRRLFIPRCRRLSTECPHLFAQPSRAERAQANQIFRHRRRPRAIAAVCAA
jgi:hypothetical protein